MRNVIMYAFRLTIGKMIEMSFLDNYKRVVIKIGSSTLTHAETGSLNFSKMERLVRSICDYRNSGMDVCLVSSGAIAVGRDVIGIKERPSDISIKQACAAVGQGRLMMTYQKLFSEYNQNSGQVLMTKNTIVNPVSRRNVMNTFEELFDLNVVPIVNENDTVATYEIEIGDNDTLSAIVAALIDADLLILLSDIDGLYTDDPRQNPNAEFIEQVDELTEEFMHMGKASTGSNVGTGGMNTKMIAAKIATSSDVDMIIANSKDIGVLHRLLSGENEGTLFVAHKDESFDLPEFVQNLHKNQ